MCTPVAVRTDRVCTAAVVVAHVETPAAPVTPHIPEGVESVLAAMSLSPSAIGATGFDFGAGAAPLRIASTRGP